MKNKTDRLQVRLDSSQLAFLRAYSAKHRITISRMIRDFIEWLKKREDEANGTSEENED